MCPHSESPRSLRDVINEGNPTASIDIVEVEPRGAVRRDPSHKVSRRLAILTLNPDEAQDVDPAAVALDVGLIAKGTDHQENLARNSSESNLDSRTVDKAIP